jgi:hypothetical protein
MSDADNEAFERHQLRQLRGTLLRLAQRFYGQDVEINMDRFAYVAGPSWKRPQVEEEVTFLVQCNYLSRHIKPRDALDKNPPVSYALTAQGKRLLNGELQDVSIEL